MPGSKVRCACPNCNRLFTTTEENVGARRKCPGCKEFFVITPMEEAADSSATVQEARHRSENGRRGKRAFWPLVAAFSLLLFLAGALVLSLLVWMVYRTGTNGEQVRGSYARQGQTFRGLNAKHYCALMMDADRITSRQGAVGLQHLGSEGVPYLLNGILHFQQTGQRDHLNDCLLFCDPRLVDAADLPIFVRLLHTEAVRDVLRFFVRQDGAGRSYLSDIRALLNDPPAPFADPQKRGWGRAPAGVPLSPPPVAPANAPPAVAPPLLREQFVWEIRAFLHEIDPEREPAPGESPHERVLREHNERQMEEREAQRRKAVEIFQRRDREQEERARRLREEMDGRQKERQAKKREPNNAPRP